MEKPKQKVLCIGSAGKDVFFPVSSGIVMEADEKLNCEKQFCFGYGGKVHVEDRFCAPGGCACNISIGLSRLSVDAHVLGNIGNDSDGEWIKNVLLEEGVNIENMCTVDDVHTDLSVIIVDANTGERTIFVNRDVGENLIIDSGDVVGFDWCFVGSLYGNHIQDNMKIIHDAVTKNEIKLVYNPGNNNIAKDETVVLDLIHHASVVFVNKTEAMKIVSKFDLSYNEEDLSSEYWLLKILKSHIQDDAGVVVLTDGLRGAWGYDGENLYHTDTINKPVHDSTGAGDAFSSGFFAGLLHGVSLDECMQWGSVNGDAVVDYYGAQQGLQTCDTVQEKVSLFPVENKK